MFPRLGDLFTTGFTTHSYGQPDASVLTPSPGGEGRGEGGR